MDDTELKVSFGTLIDDVDLRVRTKNNLKNIGCNKVGDLCLKTKEQIAATRCFGKKSLMEIDEFLERHGLHYGMDASEFPTLEQLEVEVGYITRIAEKYLQSANEIRMQAYRLYTLADDIRKRYLKD